MATPDLGAKAPNALHTEDEKTSIDRTAAPSPEDEKNSQGEKPEEHHVDVESGKAEFEALRRTLSRASSLHRVATGQKSLEDADDGEDFDLKEYMVRRVRVLISSSCGRVVALLVVDMIG